MNNLARSLVVTGELVSDEDIAIEGHVHGHVCLRGSTLIIAEHAQVNAEVHCARVEVRGKVTGTISATERIELLPSAEVTANLIANQVVIADGAIFGGRIDMNHRTIAGATVGLVTAAQPGAKPGSPE